MLSHQAPVLLSHHNPFTLARRGSIASAAAESLASPLGKLGLKSPAGQRPRRGAASGLASPLGRMQLSTPAVAVPAAGTRKRRGGKGARVLFAEPGEENGNGALLMYILERLGARICLNPKLLDDLSGMEWYKA